MKIVLTGPKCSGKSRIGKLLSQNVSLPFFETDEIIEQIFMKEKGKDLSCRAICSEYGEDVFRGYERRAIKQIAEYDFCVVSTGGSALLNKESRELLRRDSILVLLYASTSALLERLSKKDVPAFLNDKNSRDLFAARANLVIETLKPFADIVINSSEMDSDKTLSVLISNLRSIPELSPVGYLNSKSSALLFLGQINPLKFLFSLNEKLMGKPEVKKKQFTYSELPGIVVKREELSSASKSWINLFSIEADKKLTGSISDIHKKYFIGADRKKTEVLSPVMAGVLARNILEDAGIKINAAFAPAGKKQDGNIRSLSIEISVGSTHKKKQREFFSAISMFFLSCVDVRFEFDENEQQLPDIGHIISFKLNNLSAEEEKILAEIVNLYCALIIFNILF